MVGEKFILDLKKILKGWGKIVTKPET